MASASGNPFEPSPRLASTASAPHILEDDLNNPFFSKGVESRSSLDAAPRLSLPLSEADGHANQSLPVGTQAVAVPAKSLLDASLDEFAVPKQNSLPLTPLTLSLERVPTGDSQQVPPGSPGLDVADLAEKPLNEETEAAQPDEGQADDAERMEEARQRFNESAQRLAAARQRKQALQAHLMVFVFVYRTMGFCM